jgi:hypothetical protein
MPLSFKREYYLQIYAEHLANLKALDLKSPDGSPFTAELGQEMWEYCMYARLNHSRNGN